MAVATAARMKQRSRADASDFVDPGPGSRIFLEPTTASRSRMTRTPRIPRSRPQKITMKTITKDQFVAVLNEAGITDAQKQGLHAAFEARHPQAHEAFLHWLGLPPADVRAIREQARKTNG